MQKRICCGLLSSLCFVSVYAGPIQLSLNEAILLAIRNNPNVKQSQLTYVTQKFNLYVQQWQFNPHYALQASATKMRTITPGVPAQYTHGFSVQPGLSLLTPMGTQLTATFNNNYLDDHYSPSLSLQVMQPLIRGFGRPMVEVALYNAMDSEKVSRLNIENTLRMTVTAVINAYLDVMSAERTLFIDQEAVKRAEQSVQQTKMFIQAGRKAGNELVTVQANVAYAKTLLENDKNNLLQAKYSLLAAIGIDPNTPVSFSTLNVNHLIQKYHLPTLEQTKQWMLANDIQYQVDQITLYGSTTRNVQVAEDNTRWQLNFNANITTGNASSNNQNAGLNGLFNGTNQTQSIGLTLQVPIDNQLLKQAVVNAKVALRQAEIALRQEKWNKETSAINGWNTVLSAKHTLLHAEEAEHLQDQTYQVNYQKYLHGLVNSLELQTAQTQLILAQQTLLRARIGYLKALVNLDLFIGQTLKTWHVKISNRQEAF
jgi:outer membrane protein TolC